MVVPAGSPSAVVDDEILAVAERVRALATRALGGAQDVPDVVQETAARALLAARHSRIPADLPVFAFVHGIAKHVIGDELRRRARDARQVEISPAQASTQTSPLEVLVRAEECELVRRALQTLPQRDRDLLRRCVMDGDKLMKLARDTGEPVERIRQRKFRALKQLRSVIAADGTLRSSS